MIICKPLILETFTDLKFINTELYLKVVTIHLIYLSFACEKSVKETIT